MYASKMRHIQLDKVLDILEERQIYIKIAAELGIRFRRDNYHKYTISEMNAYYIAYKMIKNKIKHNYEYHICFKVFNHFLQGDKKIEIPDYKNIGKGKYDSEFMD